MCVQKTNGARSLKTPWVRFSGVHELLLVSFLVMRELQIHESFWILAAPVWSVYAVQQNGP